MSEAFYFIRHGQTDWNAAGRPQGHTDVPLNRVGYQQAHAAAEICAPLGLRLVVSSPLSRAAETARIIAARAGAALRFDDDLREIDYGQIEEHPEQKVDFAAFWRGDATAPGAEGVRDFLSRVRAATIRALEEAGPVLLVSHGGTWRGVTEALDVAPRMRMPNAAPVRVWRWGGAWRMEPLEDIALEPMRSGAALA